VKKKAPIKKKVVKKKATPKKTKKAATKQVKRKTSVKNTLPKTKTKSKTKTKEKNLKPKILHVKLAPEVLKIRERLIRKRSELMKLIQSSQSIEREAADLNFSNEIDLASSLEGREMTFQLSSRDRNELKLMEDTLFRINKGDYGKCETCEKKISMKRLQIMPLTALCIECQETSERF
jgi:DnaK suppressor protein